MTKTLALLVVAGATFAVNAQDSIAYWAQNNNVTSTGGFGFEVGDFPQGADFGLQAGTAGLSINSDWLADNNGTSYNGLASFAGSTLNAQFGEPAGGSLSPQGGTNLANNGRWFEVSFDSSSYEDIILSFAARRTNAGFNDVDVDAYSGSTLLGSVAADLNFNASGFDVVYSFNAALLDGVSDARIRFTLNGATNATGNNRYDNILVQGTLIPTPASVALLAFGGLMAARRRRA
jgi:hypothetical protein